ncbi:hypothetical protein QYM36_018532 [Artemia franciscana]|uniref:PiggyBac transposable element-derived protein domain-containing protein n=1 Tax=Artemia franciscana TaxID=6661 RepID=A0AA88KUH9_ARTSF|nr:hypothetical protein QYM36_018532 [Artemia franciscana]
MPHYDEVQTPLDLFRMFITEDILSNIVDQTNLNAMRKKNLALKLSLEELRRFLGVQMLMSILKLPAIRMYWENGIRYSPVADTMSRDRFISLRSFLHICYDTLMIPKGEVGHDKLFKIRRLYDAFRENLKKNRQRNEIQSIDEQMIPFKGRIGFRQYLKDKPHSWGVKVFTGAGISGIVYDIEIYTGKGAVEISELGQGTDVVLRLVENLPRFMNFKLFFDNFYTGIDLIHKLRVEYGTESCGTIRSNRMRGAVLDTNAYMKKKGRGSVDFRFERHSEVSVVKWYDNKPVHLASSYCAVTPIDKCQRWDGTTRKYVEVDRPRIVPDYNKSMGGVDLADMFLELYRTDIRSKKWYTRIMSKVKSSLETSDHESLESLTVMNEKSVAVLLDMLKDVIGSFKVPGGKFNASQICSRIQYLHQRTIEENIELLRIENSRLNEVVNLQKELERIKSQKNGQIYVPAPQQASYAQALKGPETFSVILEPVSVEKRNRMNFDEAMQVTESISRVVKGENSDFSVKKVVPAKEGRVILELGSKRELEAAMSVLTEKVSDTKYKPKEVKKHFPRMLVNGAPSPQVKDESEKYLLQCNPEIQRMANEGESFRIITILENASKRKVVVEVSPKIRQFILSQRGLRIGFILASCDDYVHLIRCSKCCLYGHRKTDCRADEVCSWLLGPHTYKNCDKSFSSRPNCRACEKNKLKSDGHAAYELSKCPVAKKLTARLKNNIQFN